ncbi:type VII secretion-associated serine protease mycosin [Streptomyces sp. PKU-EA00015]|uniref:type VII secretion-associated serine protease mycosin n=1 Tax=Streptomyces sp. PKU-EA00015 TaxID=2748326 RepID=UPI0015A02FC1|nr:type VII secretion-associated serine protease mycosin [Streptomyces sp. PKU-EA00015]NWF25170.1 type VII secretion-associated serine protease mycosin [Streptomyces sp. PKU-EA00015]
MHACSRQPARLRYALTAAMGLILAGIATVPAHAETVRDQQWHLDAMHAEEMWKTSIGEGITVAVIDSGVDKSVADLRGQILDGVDYSGLKGDEHTDQQGHGTGMAALIAATGARGKSGGSYGLAPGVKILPIKMPYADPWAVRSKSRAKKYAADMAQAIRFAADSDAKVINISMGGPDADYPELNAAVKHALAKGKLIFAAVGNSGDISNEKEYPAATPGVVGVAGVDKNAKPVKDSQWGSQVDIAAPGKDMVSACAGGTQLCDGTGTSAASALASASAALLWSQHPDWTNNQVLRVLLQTASGNEKGLSRDDVIGYGVARPRIALKNPGNPGPADKYPLPDFTYEGAKAPSPESPKASDAAARPSTAPVASDDDSSATPLWIAAGIGAAVVLGATVAIPVIRNRRRTAPPTPAAAAPDPYGVGQPYDVQPPLPPNTAPHNRNRSNGGT